METVDAVVIGAGPNGLVAAIALADAGWDTLLVEAQGEVGGAVRSAELVDGVVSDLFSAFYPLAAASPVIQRLELERHGLVWSHAPAVVAHCARPADETCAVLHRDPAATAAGLDADHPGDGQAWLDLFAQWQRLRDPLLAALFTPIPPVRSGVDLLRRAGLAGTLGLARLGLLPSNRLGAEYFGGEAGPLLIAGNAMHADVPMDAAGSGLFGWMLAMLGQDVGFPVPTGGAGQLAQAMARRASAAGARLATGDPVTSVVVGAGRALGVRTAGGRTVRARRAVLADVDAPQLFGELIDRTALPPSAVNGLRRFEWDLPTVKLNWVVDGGIPWRAEAARLAGTVHVGTGLAGLARWSSDLTAGLPTDPVFALVGQMTTADATRSPAGVESAWAYSHLPRGQADQASAERLAEQIEATVEDFAPGFRERIGYRMLQTPADLQDADANLRHGALNGGTAQPHQQLVLRPWPGLGRPETAIDRLYLASASAHPGGGVHGACGWNAAQAALHGRGLRGAPTRRLVVSLTRRLGARPQRSRPGSTARQNPARQKPADQTPADQTPAGAAHHAVPPGEAAR